MLAIERVGQEFGEWLCGLERGESGRGVVRRDLGRCGGVGGGGALQPGLRCKKAPGGNPRAWEYALA